MGRRHDTLIPLSHQHHHGLVLSQAIELGLARRTDLPSLVSQAIAFWQRDLVPHFAAEEDSLFPAMERELGRLPLIADLLAEHRRIAALAQELETGPAIGAGATLRSLAGLLREHIKKEENELFPLFEQRLPEPVARALAPALRVLLDRGPQERGAASLQEPQSGDPPKPDAGRGI